jgi:hypothetical protein
MVPFLPIGSIRDTWGVSLLGGLGPILGIWMGLLAAALVGDYFLRRRDRLALQPFAEIVEPDPHSAPDDWITQTEDHGSERTRTIGTVEDRPAEVTLSRSESNAGRPRLSVTVACDCPWTLDVQPRNLGSRLLGMAVAAVSTGYPDVDAALVVQADDVIGVQQWLADPLVRDQLLSLFERYHLRSLTLCPGAIDGGTTLEGELVPRLGLAVQEPAGLTHALRALADSLEQRRG